MKVVTVFGTRPEIIRLSRIIPLLDGLCTHVLVHTGQNRSARLSDVFFRELGVRAPDRHLGIEASDFTTQIAEILVHTGEVFAAEKPDRVLVLGDTNSGLCAIVAARLGIPVFHMEAGNRCFDDRVPEEVNRRLIDHASTVLMPYTDRSRENLLREGIEPERIKVTGNPIFEVLAAYEKNIAASAVLADLGLTPAGYFLATFHRAENVDPEARLRGLIEGLQAVAREFGHPVVVSVHPRTRARLDALRLQADRLRFCEPFGFFDFVHLEKSARAVLSDSGTVQEECAIFGVPNVTIRDVTERPETIECGSNILGGASAADMLQAMRVALAVPAGWTAPREYLTPGVSSTVAKIVLGYTSWRRHGVVSR